MTGPTSQGSPFGNFADQRFVRSLQPSRARRRAGRALVAALAAATVRSALGADTTANWLSATSDVWTSTTAWSTSPNYPNNGTPAGTTYAAVIAATGSPYTVTLNSNIAVDTLTLNSANATLNQTSGTFTLNTATLDAGSYTLNGGTISGGTINQNGGTFLANGGTLTNVAVTGGDLNVGGLVNVLGSFSVADHNLNLTGGYNGSVQFNGQTLTNLAINNATYSGNISPSNSSSGGPQTLTLSSSVTATGAVNFSNGNTGDTLINDGVINNTGVTTVSSAISTTNFTNNGTAEATTGGTLNVSSNNWTNAAGGGTLSASGNGSHLNLSGSWTNAGAITAASASTVSFGGTWNNTGTIAATGSTLNLGGTFTLAGLGKLTADAASTVNLNANLNNTGGTFFPGGYGGQWTMTGGTLTGGTLDTATTANGSFAGITGGTLTNVAVTGGDLNVGGLVNVLGSFSVADHNLNLTGGYNGSVQFNGQTLTNLAINNATYSGNISPSNSSSGGPQTLTLSSSVTATGAVNFSNGNTGDTLINDGVINNTGVTTVSSAISTTNFTNNGTAEATTGGTLNVSSNNWTNAAGGGTLSASGNGSHLNLSGSWTNAGAITAASASTVSFGGTWNNTGTIAATGSTLNLGGTFTLAGLGKLTADAASTVNLNANLNNTGGTFFPGGYGGQWTMTGGTLTGGTLDTATTANGSFAGITGGTLTNVAVTGGDLNVGGLVNVLGSFSVADHNLNLTGGYNGSVQFNGQTLTNLAINNATYSGNISPSNSSSGGPQTLTLSSSVTATGAVNFSNGNTGDTLINDGVINNTGVTTVSSAISTTNFTNNGTAEATTGGTLNIDPGTFTNNGRLYVSGGGTISSNQMLNVGEGSLGGSGTIDASVLLQNDPSSLVFDIGGTTKGTEYDSLLINGSLSLGGDLDLYLTDGFKPTAGETFTILTMGNNDTMSGAFLNVANGGTVETADGLGSFVVNYSGNQIVLSGFDATAVPEPTGVALLGLAWAALLRRQRVEDL